MIACSIVAMSFEATKNSWWAIARRKEMHTSFLGVNGKSQYHSEIILY